MKHKDSEKKRIRKAKKLAKESAMETESLISPILEDSTGSSSLSNKWNHTILTYFTTIYTVPSLTKEELLRKKLEAKYERKKANASKLFYKKKILNISGKNGPRAINRCGV